MGRAIEAQNEEAGLYGVEGIEICRDGCVRPSGGAVKITPDYESNRVLCERIEASRLLVDERDARLGKPRTLVYVSDCAPEILAARYPKHKKDLKDCENSGFDDLSETTRSRYAEFLVKRIRLFEVWHLPSRDVDTSKDSEWGLKGGKPTHDGRHLLLAGPSRGKAIPLIDEPWPLSCFPVVVFRVKRRMTGWKGHSFVERLMRLQMKLDQYQERIDGMLNLYSRVIMYINTKAGIKVSALSNEWSRIIEGDIPAGEAIHQFTPASVPADLLARVKDLIQWSRESVGKDDLALMGRKPPGVESGVALRTLLDQDQIRQSDIFRAWEQFHVDAGKVTIEMWRLLAARNPSFKVSWGTDTELMKVPWSKIDLDNQRFKLRAWPVSLFSSTPGAKLEQLVELFQATGIEKSKAVPILAAQFPDIAAIFGDENAYLSNIEAKLAKVIDDRAVTDESLPHGFLNLTLAQQTGLARLNACEADGAPREVLAALEQWLELVKQEQAKQAPLAPPNPAEALPSAMNGIPPLQ